jgi:lipooligosaccharide transport system permease protein
MKRSTHVASTSRLPELTYRVWKVWRRDFDVFMKTYKVNFFPPLLEPIFYLLAMGLGLGTFVSSTQLGYPYIKFIAPALVSISIMYSSFFECTYGSFVRMYFQKTFDAIITTPINIEEVIAGELFWGATRSLISASIVLAVVAAFRLISSPSALLIPILAFSAGLMFSAIAMCFTALAPNIDFFNYPGFLFITPMFLLSGTFFPLTILPQFMQILAKAVLPLTHTVILARGLMFGDFEPAMLLSIGWIALVTIVFFLLSIDLMKKKLIK